MAEGTANKNKWKESLQNNYKIVIMDEEDLREVSSYSLSLKNIYLLVLFTLLLITASAISLIVFTPLKSLIPGYGKIENDKAYQELFVKIEDLENKLKAQDVYTIGLQNMLKGIEESSGQKILTPKEAESINSVDIIESEKQVHSINFYLHLQ